MFLLVLTRQEIYKLRKTKSHFDIIYIYSEITRRRTEKNEYSFAHGLFNLPKPTGYVMHQQFNIQQLYVLPTLYLYVFCLSEKEERIVPRTA